MDDSELLHSCIKGDKQAWNLFVDTYSRLVYKYIYSTFKTRGRDIPDEDRLSDIFQEIFLSLIRDNSRKLRSFRGRNGCTLASWLRQVVINATLDYMRKERLIIPLQELSPDDEISLAQMLEERSSASADKTVLKEKFSGLTDCIQGLETDEKYFLGMHLDMGLTLEELREYFKLTRGAVDMRKSRIVDRLKECFKSKGLIL
ncbi:MAG: sigma-70 family RNA polymerase sigma factor [Candidatus Omnitrophota bacterium]|jgi:RNA polymerase sigma factor (sigma-70 family)